MIFNPSTAFKALIAATLMGTASTNAVDAAVPKFSAADYAADANALPALIHDNYAYLDELPGGDIPTSPQMDAERASVHDADSLLRYAEDMVAALADHHALTGPSFGDDWAIIPSYADLWIVRSGQSYVVDSVKDDSLAARAGILRGDKLVRVGPESIDVAVAEFWSRLGVAPTGERLAYAARVLAAGRRNAARVLTFATPAGNRTFTLDTLYREQAKRNALSVSTLSGATTIRFNNSIGDLPTIGAFDRAMAAIPPHAPIIIDLTDTPSGGSTAIARAIMSWFITKPTAYQLHQLPSEERETGVVRQWVEYVVPRAGEYHPGPVQVKVGRWTGSMGEGIGVGFMAIGKPVCGTRMAGLKGAVYDFDLPRTGLRVKLPAERIYTVSGEPRHHVAPLACRSWRW